MWGVSVGGMFWVLFSSTTFCLVFSYSQSTVTPVRRTHFLFWLSGLWVTLHLLFVLTRARPPGPSSAWWHEWQVFSRDTHQPPPVVLRVLLVLVNIPALGWVAALPLDFLQSPWTLLRPLASWCRRARVQGDSGWRWDLANLSPHPRVLCICLLRALCPSNSMEGRGGSVFRLPGPTLRAHTPWPPFPSSPALPGCVPPGWGPGAGRGKDSRHRTRAGELSWGGGHRGGNPHSSYGIEGSELEGKGNS